MRRTVADGYLCRACSKVVGATKNNRYRTHKNPETGINCELSSEEIPGDLLAQAPSDTKTAGVPEEGKDFAKCPQCGRNVKLTRLGYFPQHQTTLYGGEQCSTTGVRAFHAGGMTDVPLPGDTVPEGGVLKATRPKVSNQLEVERERVGKPTAGVSSPTPAGTAPVTETPTVEAAVHAAAAASSAWPTGKSMKELPPGGPSPDDFPPTEEEAREALKTFDGPARSNLIQQPMALTEEILAQWSEVEVQAEALRAAASAPEAATSGASTETNSPESGTTSTGLPPPSDDEPFSGPFPLGPSYSSRISQPVSLILQPPPYSPPEKPGEMTVYAREVATRIKETFYSYDNRKSSDNRSAQTTLGPSEIGTPCDRRLAMALLNVPPVNPGGDGWAAFVGTMGHEGMGKVYTFANAGTGRYVVEMPLKIPSVFVPRGTTDLLDRKYGDITDWKFMGEYSLKKFKLNGPSDTYRIQAQTYGLGAKEAGEMVRRVVIVGLPRGGGSLDDMWVWEEKFDPKVGRAALRRVDAIAYKVEAARLTTGALAADTAADLMRLAATFPTADDCRYCPFYLKGDKEMRRGCPGA